MRKSIPLSAMRSTSWLATLKRALRTSGVPLVRTPAAVAPAVLHVAPPPSKDFAQARFASTTTETRPWPAHREGTDRATALACRIEAETLPLYAMIKRSTSPEEVAEACLQRAASREEERANDSSAEKPRTEDDLVVEAGIAIVEAQVLMQAGLHTELLTILEKAFPPLHEALGPKSYYVGWVHCIRGRVLGKEGKRDEAIAELDQIEIPTENLHVAMPHAPEAESAALLRAYACNSRAALLSSTEAIEKLQQALQFVQVAIDATTEQLARVLRPTEAAGKGEGADVPAMSKQAVVQQANNVARTMRSTLLLDIATMQLRLHNFDEAKGTLSDAEAAIRALPNYTSDEEQPAMAYVQFNHANAAVAEGQYETAAAKAGAAARIIATACPTAFDFLAEVVEVKALALSRIGHGSAALEGVDEAIGHIGTTVSADRTVDRSAGDHAIRKLSLVLLAVLDERAQAARVVRLHADITPMLENGSPEGRLFADSRKAQALGGCGKISEALHAMTAVRDRAKTVVPSRVADLELARSAILLASGRREEAMEVRDAALAAIPEPEREAPSDVREWLFTGATVAAAAAENAPDIREKEVCTARVEKLLDEAAQLYERDHFCFLAAPVYLRAGLVDTAATLASEYLEGVAEELSALMTQRSGIPCDLALLVGIRDVAQLRAGDAKERLEENEHTKQVLASFHRMVDTLRIDALTAEADSLVKLLPNWATKKGPTSSSPLA